MTGSEAARITIVGIDGTELDLTWLQQIRVPPGVRVEVADVGYRIDLVVSSGAAHVALVVDVATGEVLVEERLNATADLEAVALHVASARKGARTGAGGAEPSEKSSPRILFRNINWPFRGG